MRPWIIACTILTALSSQAQPSGDTTTPRTCLFSRFREGTVLQKDGTVASTLLNYNTENQTFLFKQNGQTMVLTNLDNIDTIYIGEKKFIPAEDKFYLVATTTEFPLLISYTYKPTPLQAQAEHTGTTRRASNVVSNNVSEAYVNRRFQGQYEVEFIPQFWLRRGHSLYKANTEKQIIRALPQKEALISEYIRNNKPDLRLEKDVTDLILSCEK
ncbi:MAG: hypothetical protein JST42_03960 [Bacteroidetes bacterium]|nr:hypothetical protein [Bacteroidota bacterium]